MKKTILVILISLVTLSSIIGCTGPKKSSVSNANVISNSVDFYNKLNSVLIWDGVNSKLVSIELFFKDKNNEVIHFKNIKIPVRIQLYSTHSERSKEKVRLLYDEIHLITSPNPTIKILEEKINYTSQDKNFGITVVQIEKPDGTKVVEETTSLMLYILRR